MRHSHGAAILSLLGEMSSVQLMTTRAIGETLTVSPKIFRPAAHSFPGPMDLELTGTHTARRKMNNVKGALLLIAASACSNSAKESVGISVAAIQPAGAIGAACVESDGWRPVEFRTKTAAPSIAVQGASVEATQVPTGYLEF